VILVETYLPLWRQLNLLSRLWLSSMTVLMKRINHACWFWIRGSSVACQVDSQAQLVWTRCQQAPIRVWDFQGSIGQLDDCHDCHHRAHKAQDHLTHLTALLSDYGGDFKVFVISYGQWDYLGEHVCLILLSPEWVAKMAVRHMGSECLINQAIVNHKGATLCLKTQTNRIVEQHMTMTTTL